MQAHGLAASPTASAATASASSPPTCSSIASRSCRRTFRARPSGSRASARARALVHFLFPAEPRHHQPDFVIGNFRWKRLFERLKLLPTQASASVFNFLLFLSVNPLRAKFHSPTRYQVGDHRDNCAQLTAANLGNLVERVPLREQLGRFHRGTQLLLGRWGGARPLAKSFQSAEDLFSIHFRLALAEA